VRAKNFAPQTLQFLQGCRFTLHSVHILKGEHMARMPFSRKAKYGLAITAMLGTMVGMGSSIAYFSSRQTTDTNTLQTGTLQVDISQSAPLAVSNWQPGESRQLEVTIVNTGQLPLHALAKLDASWSNPLLSTSMIERTSVERWFAGNWIPVISTTEQAESPLFISTDGTESTLLTLATNQMEKYRMTIQLSPDATDEYQGESLTGSVEVVAKQTTAGAPWPTE